MSDFFLRSVEPRATAELARLYGAAFEDARPGHSLAALLRTPGAWCVLALPSRSPAGPPVGFVIARLVVDEAEVLSLGVAPGWRRRGVGRALLAEVLRRAAKGTARAVYLEVGEDNEAAQALYRASGFEVIARRANYYRRPDRVRVAALVMRRCV